MWQYHYMEELYHHGIKGQKWGIRRFQNKDGTLTSAGKKRYNEDADRTKKITDQELRDYRQEMIAKFDKNAEKKRYYQTSSDQELRQDIDRKQRMKKIAIGVGITAGIGVGIFCAYKFASIQRLDDQIGKGLIKDTKDKASLDAARKIMKDSIHDTDIVLDKGSVLHRMSAYSDIDFSKVRTPTYVSYKEKDVLKYMTQLRDWSGTGKRFDVELEATKDIRMPNKKVATKIFNELWNSDEQYREDLKESLTKTYYSLTKTKPGDPITDSLATLFMRRRLEDDKLKAATYSIVRKGKDSQTLIEHFRKYGYDAIEDYFDKGSFTKSPVILFDPSSSVVKRGERFVTEEMLKEAKDKLHSKYHVRA